MSPNDLPAMWSSAHKRYPQHSKRIERGRAIFEQHLQQPRARIITARLGVDHLSFVVRSQSNPRSSYTVDRAGCTCPDWPRTHRCKHFIAVAALCALLRIKLQGMK